VRNAKSTEKAEILGSRYLSELKEAKLVCPVARVKTFNE
jgi:hypothetical protein